MKKWHFNLVLLAAMLLPAQPLWAARGIVLPEGYVQSKGAYTCGYVDQKWIPGNLKNGEFFPLAQQLRTLRKRLHTKLIPSPTLQRRIRRLRKAIADADRELCSTLSAPGAGPTPVPTISSLRQMPDPATFARANQAPSRTARPALSGQPPTIPQIPARTAEALFWRPGVLEAILSGSASPAQCNEFYGGSTDGESGGLEACRSAQSLGIAFDPVVRGGMNLCYVKNILTPANIDSGAVRLESGTLPDNDITKLFSVPEGAQQRLVQLTFQNAGQEARKIFIKIFPADDNQQTGNAYRFDMWHCGAENTVEGAENTAISAANGYHSTFAAGGSVASFRSIIDAEVLTDADGNVTFDPARQRSLSTEASILGGIGASKSGITVTPENLLEVKSFDSISFDLFGQIARKGYQVSHFSGTSIADLRFLEGAWNVLTVDPLTTDQKRGTAEFRDSFYAAAPASSLAGTIDAVNLSSDSFYQAPPAVVVDLSPYSCSAAADIVLAVDYSQSVITQAVASCRQATLAEMTFCYTDTIQTAQMAWMFSCGGMK